MKSKGLAHPGQALQAGILNQRASQTKGSYLICILQWQWDEQGLSVSRVVNRPHAHLQAGCARPRGIRYDYASNTGCERRLACRKELMSGKLSWATPVPRGVLT